MFLALIGILLFSTVAPIKTETTEPVISTRAIGPLSSRGTKVQSSGQDAQKVTDQDTQKVTDQYEGTWKEGALCPMAIDEGFLTRRCEEDTFQCSTSPNVTYTKLIDYDSISRTASIKVSLRCPNDRAVYQACGVGNFNVIHKQNLVNMFDQPPVCGVICQVRTDRIRKNCSLIG